MGMGPSQPGQAGMWGRVWVALTSRSQAVPGLCCSVDFAHLFPEVSIGCREKKHGYPGQLGTFFLPVWGWCSSLLWCCAHYGAGTAPAPRTRVMVQRAPETSLGTRRCCCATQEPLPLPTEQTGHRHPPSLPATPLGALQPLLPAELWG